jgi:hypothetical protein
MFSLKQFQIVNYFLGQEKKEDERKEKTEEQHLEEYEVLDEEEQVAKMQEIPKIRLYFLSPEQEKQIPADILDEINTGKLILNEEDNKAQEEHKYKEFIIVDKNYYECKSELIIKKLYSILVRNKNCFLEGAFVFSDNDGKLLETLTSNCGINNWRFSIKDTITHNVFINENEFKKLQGPYRQSVLDTKFLRNMKVFYPEAHLFRYFMYENSIKDKDENEKTLDYLCDPGCSDEKKECENKKFPKRVILFYPFKVRSIESGHETEHQYLYLKLEASKSVSFQHALESVEAYTNPKIKDDNSYPRRRERLIQGQSNKDRYSEELREKDKIFYESLNIELSSDDEIRFYNENVRAHNELFIPQEITDILLIDKENDELP